MLRGARTLALARIAAVLVAAMLSGAPRVLALGAPVEGHRCACRTHSGDHRECDCAICRKAALRAKVRDQALPPCHRAAARDALADAGSRDGTACVEGTCGNEDRPGITIAGLELFCVPADGAPSLLLAEAAPQPLPPRPQDRTIDPETPPPRAA